MEKIAWRISKDTGRPLYVCELKVQGHDWGYTYDRKKAIVLTPWWQRRFAADMAYCGDEAGYCPVKRTE